MYIMKKRLTIFLTLLCMSVMGWAYDLAPNTTFGGNYKWQEIDGVTPPANVVNVQSHEGYDCLYITFADAAFNRDYIVGGDVFTNDGAQAWLKLASYTEASTDVLFYNTGSTTDVKWGLRILNTSAGGGGNEPEPAISYCRFETGHLGNAAHGDVNGRILLTLRKLSNSAVRVKIEPNNNGNDYFDLVHVELNGVAKELGTVGGAALTDIEFDYTGLASLDFSINVLWHNHNWADANGRWTTGSISVTEAELCTETTELSTGSEYCCYYGNETQSGSHYATLTWETNDEGDVVITIGEGPGETNTRFRGNGFEGNLDEGFSVLSGEGYATSEVASTYFNRVLPSGDKKTYTLQKKGGVTLPSPAKIKFTTKAFAWTCDQAGAPYSFPTFEYTYGKICNQLDAPTNVAIDGTNHITFNTVANATRYTAFVSIGAVVQYSQIVASGDELLFAPIASGDYHVSVVAWATGYTESDPSTDYIWHWDVAPVELGNSEYCEANMSSGNTLAGFTWETDANGNIVITISEALGGAANATHFRGNALALANFKVGAGQAAGSNYFSHPGTTTGNQLVLTTTNAPALGEKIYYNGVVEYATSLDGNAWPTLAFEWTYGTECSGITVSATPNNNTMGTAVVKKGDDVVTSVESGDQVTFIATVADAELYRFVNWTKGGVEVSTSATYTTTITETTNLVANFDYIRNTYCHAEINSIQNKKLYLTLGSIGGGQYQIKFEGSAEAKLTALNNANYTVNWVTTAIEDGDEKMSGQDVPFNNARWNFSASGYGAATMTFGISEGKTWEDIYVWNHAIYFMTAEGEVGYTSFPDRYHIAWTETCADAEAPVFAKAEGAVLDANSVRLTIQASDNWDGMLTYTIARAGADPIISNHASGEEFTQEVTGLTTGTEYTFTVTVSDGVNNTNQNIVITPVGDDTKPVMGDASLASKTWNSAVINVAATDNIGVAAYYIVELDAEYVALEDKITIENLIQGTPYTFTIKAKDAAGNLSDNSSEVNFTTNSHLIAPTTAPVVPAWPAAQVMSIYSDAYTPNAAWGFLEGWGQSTTKTDMVIAENKVMKYSNFNYLGWQTAAPYNAMTMEKLHLDIWVADDCTIGIIPIYGGTSLTTDDSHRVKPTLIGQQWNSVDLDLATDYAGLNVSSIFQFKFDQGTTTEFFIDNVYFYRTTELVDDIAPTNVSGSVTSTSYYSVVLAVSATDDNDAVNYIIKNGDTQVASGSGASGATINIKVANLAAGTNYAFSLIAKDGNDNAAAPVIVNVSTLAAPAPAPVPTYNSGLVKSLYSDAYTPIVTVENYCEWWWESPTVHTNHTLGNGDHVLFYDNNHQAGASFGWAWNANNKIDFSGYQNMHLSVYPTTSGTIEIYPVIAPEGEFHMVSQTLTAGEWNEIELDYSAKTFAPLNQIGFINFYGLGEFFIDNVYFWSYGVATNQDNWSTFACAQKMQVPSGITAYKAAYSNEGGDEVLTLTALSDGIIPSNVGVLLKSQTPSTAYAFTATDATPATDMSDNSLVGCVTRTDISDVAATNDIFCLRRSDLFETSGFFLYTGQFIPAGKAYLPVPKEDATPAPSRRIRFVYDTTTAIDNNAEAVRAAKFIEDGQFFIRRGDAVYTIQGVRVK